MQIKGKVWKFGSNIDTDVIIPARYLNTSDPSELAKHCMENIDKDFVKKIEKGDIIVAGKNFGCGSSREHAPVSIKAAGISCVIAKTFARIFYRNAINTGLLIVECPEASDKIERENIVRINIHAGKIENLTKKEEYLTTPFPPFMQKLIAAGGLMPYVAIKEGLEEEKK